MEETAHNQESGGQTKLPCIQELLNDHAKLLMANDKGIINRPPIGTFTLSCDPNSSSVVEHSNVDLIRVQTPYSDYPVAAVDDKHVNNGQVSIDDNCLSKNVQELDRRLSEQHLSAGDISFKTQQFFVDEQTVSSFKSDHAVTDKGISAQTINSLSTVKSNDLVHSPGVHQHTSDHCSLEYSNCVIGEPYTQSSKLSKKQERIKNDLETNTEENATEVIEPLEDTKPLTENTPECEEASVQLSSGSKSKRGSKCKSGSRKSYKCNLCEQSFSSSRLRLKHLNKHLADLKSQPKNDIVPKKRDVKFRKTKNRLIVNEPEQSPAIESPAEHADVDPKQNQQKHTRKSRSKKIHQCRFCEQTFQSLGALKIHKQENHSNKRRLHVHAQTVSCKIYSCRFCEQTFNFFNDRRKHEKDHNLTCQFCNKKLGDSATKKIHERLHTGEKPYQCHQCGKCFTARKDLKFHVNRHAGIKPYRCRFCEKCYSRPHERSLHENTHTGNNTFTCQYCDKLFVVETFRDNHERRHTGEEPFRCRVCDKTFRTKVYRNNHEKSHSNGNPYKCKICGHSCMNKGHFETHQRTHTGERPFLCQFCGKGFTESSARIRHERIHTGEKPYKCQVCNRAFNQTSTLKHHERTHSTETPFQCSFCGKSFSQASTLRQHEKRHRDEKCEQTGPSQSSNDPTSHPKNDAPMCNAEYTELIAQFFQCQYCEQTFPVSSTRDEHQLVHTVHERVPTEYHTTHNFNVGSYNGAQQQPIVETIQPLFQCQFCSQSFTVCSIRDEHQRMHSTPEEPRTQLRRTMAETVQTPFQCQYCDQSFAIASIRDAHQWIHTYNKETRSAYHPTSICNTMSYGNVDQIQCSNYDPVETPIASYCTSIEPVNITYSTSYSASANVEYIASNVNNGTDVPIQSDDDTISNNVSDAVDDVTAQIDDLDELEPETTSDGNRLETIESINELAQEECSKISAGEDCITDAEVHKNCAENDDKITNVKKNKFKCQYCDESFKTKGARQTHQILHNNEKKYKCRHCDVLFDTVRERRSHVRSHEKSLRCMCQFCGKRFKKAGDRRLHEMRHVGEKPYKCRSCEQAFVRPYELRMHSVVHVTEETQAKPYQCQYCHKRFGLKRSLDGHERTHTGEKPYHCSVCDKHFKTKAQSTVHEKSHASNNPYLCKICGLQCVTKTTFRIHKRTHTGEKPFPCQFCGKSFNESGALKRHERIHTGEKPYSCQLCGHTFNQSSSLKQHEKRH